MGCGEICSLIFASCCLFGISLGLQGAGIFTSRWVTTDTNTTNDAGACNLGLVISDCESANAPKVSKAVLGLELTAFVIAAMNIVSFCCQSCCVNPEEDNGVGIIGCFVVCSFTLYPIAGLLALIGCIISATEYSTSQFGWSFYLCVAAGCLIVLESMCLCCSLCMMAKDNDATHSSRDLAVANERSSIRAVAEETEIHAIATNNGIMIVARQLTRIMHLRSE